VFARSQTAAQRAADLIFAAYCLTLGAWPPLPVFGFRVWPLDQRARHDASIDDDTDLPADYTEIQAGGLLQAAILAARASLRKAHAYALFKLKLSYLLSSASQVDLRPSLWSRHRAVMRSPDLHVAYAFAIQTAYSAIEELGLEVRASKERPSLIGADWNPPVLTDLEGRLDTARINRALPFVWHLRDTPTKVERRYAVRATLSARVPFERVRDREIPVVDALAQASRLRSRVSAHRFNEVTASLTKYDAANVQRLARRLVIEALGEWHGRLDHRTSLSGRPNPPLQPAGGATGESARG
jgi:hypothetical protein